MILCAWEKPSENLYADKSCILFDCAFSFIFICVLYYIRLRIIVY